MNFIDACRKLISIDTTPGQSLLECIEFLRQHAESKGLRVEIQKEYEGDLEQANILIRPMEGRPALEFLLQNHLDTVDPGPFQLWNQTGHNPFDALIKDGKIYGLGSADVKLDFLCKLEALASFNMIDSWKLPPVLVGTYGEESGMLGALKLIRRQKLNAKMAIIGEPSDLQLIGAAKGFASIEIRLPLSPDEIQYKNEHNLRESTSTQSRIFKGQSAHSSTPHLGDNAIIKLLAYLKDLPNDLAILEVDGGTNGNTVPSHAMLELDFVSHLKSSIKQKLLVLYEAVQKLQQEFDVLIDPEFTPPTPTLNIGFIRTLEDHILISGNCRIPPVVTQSVYEKWMRQIQTTCEKLGGSFRVTDYKKPFRTQKESVLVKGCLDELKHLGVNSACVTQPSTNEASLFSRTGIDCVCFGPGLRDGNIHTPNEHVSLQDLETATAFYKKIIERFCL